MTLLKPLVKKEQLQRPTGQDTGCGHGPTAPTMQKLFLPVSLSSWKLGYRMADRLQGLAYFQCTAINSRQQHLQVHPRLSRGCGRDLSR